MNGNPDRTEHLSSELATAGSHALILANRLPFPLDDGWRVRTFHVVSAVARRHRTTLVVFHPPGDEPTITAAQAALGERVRLVAVKPPRAYTLLNLARGLLTRYPVHVWNQESPAMRRVIARVLAENAVDVVIAESTMLARYLDLLPSAVPRVVDTHNIDSVTFERYVRSLDPGPRRWYTAATVRRLAALERRTFGRVDAVWVCSDVERDIARGIANGRVWTVPNGVDTDYYKPGSPSAVRGSMLFFGRLNYFPNIDGLDFFAREIMPGIVARVPDARIEVVGAASTREVEDIVRATPGATLLGRVDDLRAALDRAAVVVVPLRAGGGTRLKILEAMSMARPIVSTRIGAEGLAVKDGEHLLLADSPSEFSDAVCRLLADPDEASKLGERGRQLVRDRYDWRNVGCTISESLDRVMRDRTAA